MLLEVTLRGPYTWGGRRDEGGDDHAVGDFVDQRLDRVMDHLLGDERSRDVRVDLDIAVGAAAIVVSVEAGDIVEALVRAVDVVGDAVTAAGGALLATGTALAAGGPEWTLRVSGVGLREVGPPRTELVSA